MKYCSKTLEIINMCRGKKVLHLGCVGFADLPVEDRISQAANSLHYALSKCSRATGIDYSKEAIDFFKEENIFDNVLCGDAEKLDNVRLSDQYDVIVIGDLIEHLSNPGLMLQGILRFCHGNSLIIITTPNSFGALNFIRYLIGRFKEGREHVMCFNIQNIRNLLERNGYVVDSIDSCFQDHARSYGIVFRAGLLFFKLFPGLGGTLFVKTRVGESDCYTESSKIR